MKFSVAVVALALFAAVGARAASVKPGNSDMTNTFDMTRPLHNLDGTVVRECKAVAADGHSCERTGPLELGEVIASALSPPPGLAGQSSLPPDVIAARGALAMRLIGNKHATLSLEQIAALEPLILRLPLPAWEALEAVRDLNPAYKVDESKLQ